MKIKIFLLLVSIYTTQVVFGATSTWVGATGFWDVPGNWSGGMVPDATTEVIIPVTGNVTVPAGFTANALSVTVQGIAKLTIAETAVLNISGSPAIALTIISGAKFQNKGFVNIGSGGAIGTTGVYIESSLSQCFNDTTGVMNINNVSAWAVAINLIGSFVNAGDLNIGSTGPIAFGGFTMDNVTTLFNHGTGVININNSPTGDGLYVQDSDIDNDGEINIGNLSPVFGRGISLELGSSYSNGSSATTTISRITNSGISEGVALYMSSSSYFVNSGDLLIGNNGNVNTTGIMMYFESSFNNTTNGLVEINSITTQDGISLSDEFTQFFNAGTIRIGNSAAVKRNGIFLNNLSKFTNQGTGIVEIDNINGTGSTEGHGIYMANSSINNSGQINLGTNFPLIRYGIYISVAASILNQTNGIIKVNNVSTFDGILLTGTNSAITNNGAIHVGNLLSVNGVGITMFTSTFFTNNTTGTVTINNISSATTPGGYGLYISGTFTNGGILNIGNSSTLSNLGVYLASGSLVNQLTGLVQINNILNLDGVFASGATAILNNSGVVRIGNLSPVKRYGIYLTNSSSLQNSGGQLEINNIISTASSTGVAIVLTTSSSVTNNAMINIGNIAPISVAGILFNSPSTFTNQSNGVLKISRITAQDAIQILGTSSVFNNSGQIKIGEAGPVTRVGMLITNGQFNNMAGSLLEINNIPTLDGINAGSTGATITNNGTIHIGNTTGVFRFGFLLSTAGVFSNGSTGILTINNILSTNANEGIALRLSGCTFTNNNIINIGNTANISRFGIAMSSSALLTNNATGTIQVNRASSQSGISMQLTSKIINNGTVAVGNLAPIQVVGLVAIGASEIFNNAGATMSINHCLTADAVYISGAATKMVNASTLNIGNLSAIGGRGINADMAAVFQNTSTGVINIDNVTAESILLDGTSTVLENKGQMNIQP